MPRDWGDLTAAEFSRIDPSGHVVLMPVAAVESHGPHLPLSVDAVINAGIVDAARAALPADFPLLVLPPQIIGRSEEHSHFAGTLSADAETLIAQWTALGRSVARAGFRKLVLFNSHGGQRQIGDIVALTLRRAHSMLAANVHWLDTVDLADLFDAAELRYGIHGGAVETAMMMHLRPDLVRAEALADFPSRAAELAARHRWLSPHGPAGFAWMTEDLNPAGACGDASAATAEAGRVAVERAAAALCGIVEEMSAAALDGLLGVAAYPPATPPPDEVSGR